MHAKDAWLKSLSVLNLSSSHDDRGSDWPRLLSVERAAELQFPAVDSNAPSVSELKAKQDQLILDLHQAISDGLLAAENKTELAPVEVSVRDHNGEFVRDHDGNLRTVSGMGTVEVSMLPAQAVFDWLREQGLTPSEYLAAWFGSMKVQEHSSPDRDMPDLWSEKTASVRPPKEVPRRFAERDFLEGFESVTHLLMATSGSNGRSPISRKEISAEQCAEIAARQLLDAEDWIDLTGVGIGKHGHFRIAPDGVCFIKWSDEEVATVGDSTEDQQAMLRDNKAPSLDFPCTPDTLLMFIDSLVKSETGDGSFFEVPEAFKTAVAAQRQAPPPSEAEAVTQEPVQPVGVELEPVQKQGEAEQPARADANPVATQTKEIKRVGRPRSKAHEHLEQVLVALESYAAETGCLFDRDAMPGPMGAGIDDEGSFHWLCAKLRPHTFSKSQSTFERQRAGVCKAEKGWPRKTDFYREALPHVASLLGVRLNVRRLQSRAAKAA